MSNEKPSTRELFRKISQLSSESEWTSEENRHALVEAGVDPETISARVFANINQSKKQLLASWKNAAHSKRAALLQQLDRTRASYIASLARPQLLDEIRRVIGNLTSEPDSQYAVAFRKFEQASDDDLRSLLEEIEMLRTVEHADGRCP
jgi:hypothetical protein